MSADQIAQTLTQLGLSVIFLYMLSKLWTRHMQMTDIIITVLREELQAERERKGVGQAEAD